MTLVVARHSGETMRMSSDLRVSDRAAIRSGYRVGALKVVALSPDLCVGFAGGVGEAIAALRALAGGDPASLELDQIHEALLKANRASQDETDFLVASTAPFHLARVSKGSVEPEPSSAWIGEPDAFEAYQIAYHSCEVGLALPREYENRREELEQAVRMNNAMRAVIDDDPLPTVGEAVLGASSTPSEPGFRYSPSSVMAASHEQTIASGERTKLEFGNAAQGGFAYTVLVPDAPGVGAIGIHFFQGNFGLYYDPLRLDRPAPFEGVTHDQFRAEVLERHGVAIEGNVIS